MLSRSDPKTRGATLASSNPHSGFAHHNKIADKDTNAVQSLTAFKGHEGTVKAGAITMAAMEWGQDLCLGICGVDTKWGSREFGYPMTLQKFNKSPKLDSLGHLHSPLSANTKQEWLVSV